MKSLAAFLLLFVLLQGLAKAEISIVKRGDWLVICDGVQISNHDRYDKAIQSAINQSKDCDILPPLRIEVRWIKDKPAILLTWDIPTEREDGSSIESIDKFIIYHAISGAIQDPIEVSGSATQYTLLEVAQGSHAFEISTVEDGQEGRKSPTVIEAIE